MAPTATTAPTATPLSLDGPADTALINGKVITVNPSDAVAQAVSIKNGFIQAVGTTDELRSRINTTTQVLDLQGKTLTPGLIDSHCHLRLVGMFGSYLKPMLPPEVTSVQGLKDKLAQMVAETPKGEWINAYYFTIGQGVTPRRQDLDSVSPNHPVWIMQQGGHYGTANGMALKVAGITSGTANPAGGIIDRDSNGEPTGVLYNHPAMDLLRRYIPEHSLEDVDGWIDSGQALFASCGVTSFQDNNVREADVIARYLDKGKQDQITLRGAVYFALEYARDLDVALTQVSPYSSPLMRLAGFKFLIDGQAPTAYCHEPHNGISWDMPAWEPRRFKQAVRALHDTGLQICVHCAGDAAVDLVLDAYEEAMNANPRADPRHRIEHAIFTTSEATRRMKALGVVVSFQPAFLRIGGDAWLPMFGEERMLRAMVTREWLDSGVAVALGSDAPTTPWYTPQMAMWGAMARTTYSGKVLGPEQSLTVQEALRAHTLGAAYAAHEETIKGSIEVGKVADLTVWQEDPYSVPLAELAYVQTAMTMVGGKVVYQAT
jgi:predicted amidohydrolase YtcJ